MKLCKDSYSSFDTEFHYFHFDWWWSCPLALRSGQDNVSNYSFHSSNVNIEIYSSYTPSKNIALFSHHFRLLTQATSWKLRSDILCVVWMNIFVCFVSFRNQWLQKILRKHCMDSDKNTNTLGLLPYQSIIKSNDLPGATAVVQAD